jgi:hypothetical protein
MPLRVVATRRAAAGDDPMLLDLIARWADKYPEVAVTTRVCRGIDAAVTLTAAAGCCGLAVIARPEPADPQSAAVVHAVARRSHCPFVVVGEDGAPNIS